ncbi:hypothetical protein MKX01_041202, partial [Papaver californicum]
DNLAMPNVSRVDQQLSYPPLALEDFPFMDTITETKNKSSSSTTSQAIEEYILCDKHRNNYFAESNLLDEIFFGSLPSY